MDPNENPSHRAPLLIIGASTRAAAWSAMRAGFRPICADLFADEDLRAIAEVLPVADYPRDVRAATERVPASVPWMYTGAMENQPRLIAAISARRPLWGNISAVVRNVRDPMGLVRKKATWGTGSVRLPDVMTDVLAPDCDGTWMVKPLRGAAGHGIAVWDEATTCRPARRGTCYFQKRVAGIPISSLCVAHGGAAEVLGYSRQWIGEAACHAAPFQYCGSIGPISLPVEMDFDVRRLAANLARSYQLRGLFGCDFLLDGDRLWLTEINPRYTASVEIFEFARDESVIAKHAAACGVPPNARSPTAALSSPPLRVVGKAILYAPRDVVTSELPVTRFNGELPELADVPRAGSRIPRGAPICTVFASGETELECEQALCGQLARWSARIVATGPDVFLRASTNS